MNVIRVHLLFLALVPAFALAATSNKQSVELEIHDTVRAELVRAIPASSLAWRCSQEGRQVAQHARHFTAL
jgi:hypothetical protein